MEVMTLDELHSAGIFLAGRCDWRTPRWFIEYVNRVSPIVFDPSNSATNWTRVRRYYARLEPGQQPPPGWAGLCGLAGDWTRDGNGFVNPPYGPHLGGPVEPTYVHERTNRKTGEKEVTGVGRGWAERIAQDCGELHVLVPARPDTEWWHTLHAWCTAALLWKSPQHGSRIRFIDPDTGEPGPQNNMPSTVFYRGPNVDRFVRVFGEHGRLIPGMLSDEGLVAVAAARFGRRMKRLRKARSLEDL